MPLRALYACPRESRGMRTPISSIWRLPGRSESTAVAPHHSAASFRRGPVLWLILCGVLLVAAITISTALIIGQFRERALSNSERELENTVLLLTRHFDQQFEDADILATDSDRENAIGRERLAGDFQQRDVDLRRAPDA